MLKYIVMALTPGPSILMLAILHNGTPEVCFKRLQRLLAGGKALSRGRPGAKVFGVQHVARRRVLQPVHVLQGRDIETEESETKNYIIKIYNLVMSFHNPVCVSCRPDLYL